MTEALNFFLNAFRRLFSLLDGVTFDMFGYSVSFLSIVLVFLVLSIIVSVFWKGAQA